MSVSLLRPCSWEFSFLTHATPLAHATLQKYLRKFFIAVLLQVLNPAYLYQLPFTCTRTIHDGVDISFPFGLRRYFVSP